ncbi:MAG TPA: energy transducer TonB [Bradyrhizobium sp.]
MLESKTAKNSSRRIWMMGSVVAAGIHLGCAALAYAHLKSNEMDTSLGAQALEVGLEMTSPRLEATDLPPGSDTDASTAAPAVAEQKAEVKETDLPQAVPDETEEADRVVTENESKKPKEDEAEKSAVQSNASTESVAAEATAMPTNEAAQEAPRSVAPMQGSGESAQRVRATWQKELVAHLDRHKRYPSHRLVRTTEITVAFVLDRLGHVLSTAIVKGSGDHAFDEAALDMVRRSDPVPQPPALVADEGLSFTLPVNFRVKERG